MRAMRGVTLPPWRLSVGAAVGAGERERDCAGGAGRSRWRSHRDVLSYHVCMSTRQPWAATGSVGDRSESPRDVPGDTDHIALREHPRWLYGHPANQRSERRVPGLYRGGAREATCTGGSGGSCARVHSGGE